DHLVLAGALLKRALDALAVHLIVVNDQDLQASTDTEDGHSVVWSAVARLVPRRSCAERSARPPQKQARPRWGMPRPAGAAGGQRGVLGPEGRYDTRAGSGRLARCAVTVERTSNTPATVEITSTSSWYSSRDGSWPSRLTTPSNTWTCTCCRTSGATPDASTAALTRFNNSASLSSLGSICRLELTTSVTPGGASSSRLS